MWGGGVDPGQSGLSDNLFCFVRFKTSSGILSLLFFFGRLYGPCRNACHVAAPFAYFLVFFFCWFVVFWILDFFLHA